MLSDQQIVTGLAILIAGFSQLSCSIDAYHWQIMISLAWFSSVTHLTTLTILQDYLRERPILRILRVLFMLAIVTMLTFAQLLTSVNTWPSLYNLHLPNMPATCFFPYLWSGDNFTINSIGVLLPVVFLWLNFFFRVVRLFDWSSRHATAIMRDWPLHMMERLLKRMNRRFTVPPDTTFRIGRISGGLNGSLRKSNSIHIFSFRALFLYVKVPIYCGVLSVYVIARAEYEIAETMLYEVDRIHIERKPNFKLTVSRYFGYL